MIRSDYIRRRIGMLNTLALKALLDGKQDEWHKLPECARVFEDTASALEWFQDHSQSMPGIHALDA